jgi:hypothetical protein
LTISVTVKNHGTGPAWSAHVALFGSNAASSDLADAAGPATFNAGVLAPGASGAIVFSFAVPPMAPGRYRIYAKVDPDRLVVERKEGNNNSRALPLVVLSVESQEEVYPPPDGPSGAQYYVALSGSDANDGSGARPWRTLQHAADRVVPGATVHVAPGDYQPVVTTISGTPTARIRFLSSVRWGARLVGSTVDEIWHNLGHYVDIVGFEMTGTSRYGGIDNAGSHVRIIANYIHDIPGDCSDPNGVAGINNYEYSESDSDIIANVVARIGNATQPCSKIHGIYHANLRGRIWNNITFQNAGYGIHTWHAAREVLIANNLTFANGRCGILVGAGDSPGGITADLFIVANNIVLHNRYGGICEWGTIGSNNRYLNNLVYGHTYDLLLENPDTGTIFADPQLVDYRPDGTGDYRLSTSSPAIDSGTSVGAPPTDYFGLGRPHSTSWDVGPFEWRP